MSIATYIRARLAVRGGETVEEFLEGELKRLAPLAPHGEPQSSVLIKPGGRTLTTEIKMPEEKESDEHALREDAGDSHSNNRQRQAGRSLEQISRNEMDIRDTAEQVKNHRDTHNDLLDTAPDYHHHKRIGRGSMVMFFVIVIAEIVSMAYLYGDLFGLNILNLSGEISRHPWQMASVLLFSTAFFVGSLLIAEQALRASSPGRKIFWLILLAAISILVGKLRANLAISMNNTVTEAWVLALIYSVVSFIFPMAAAWFARKWKESSDKTGPMDSRMKQYDEKEKHLTDQIQESNQKRLDEQDGLNEIVQEYSDHYKKHIADRIKLRNDWQDHARRVEAELAEARMAYKYWERQKTNTIPNVVKVAAVLLGLLLIAIAISLVSSRSAHAAENRVNMTVICDKSSSSDEISCTNKRLNEAGKLWMGKADDAGGGEFQVVVVGDSFDTAKVIFSKKFPMYFPGPVIANRRAWETEFIQSLDAIKLPQLNDSSAIAEAIFRSSLLIPNDGKTYIVVLSDLREVNPQYNFEKHIPTPTEFIHWLDANDIRPRFSSSVQLIACGCHPYDPNADTSPMTPKNYVQLIELWQAVFRHWGVKATISEMCNYENYE
ncbi:MAG: hypothetical protein M0Z75_16930 [Nitrospiraceae bacterium]|nr:hypothetical protein [Nitrospiraceae bacterium]